MPEIIKGTNNLGRGPHFDKAITKTELPCTLQSILDLMHPMDFQKQYPAPKSSHFSLSKASKLFEWR